MSRYIYILNGGAICWKSFKQHTVADSTYEVEYIVASDAVKKVVWLWKFINELGVTPSLNGPVLLYCDNTGAIAQAKEPKRHQRTKHILRRYHLVRESWIEMTSSFRRSMKRRTWLTHLLKPSTLRSSKTTIKDGYMILHRLTLVQVGVIENYISKSIISLLMVVLIIIIIYKLLN